MRLPFVILLCPVLSTPSCQTAPAEQPAAPVKVAIPADQNIPAAAPPPEDRIIRLMADAEMSPEFSNAFKDSKECRGIQLSAKGSKTRGDFKIYTSFATADTPEMEEQWLWTVFETRRSATGELRAAGRGDSPAEAVRDLCMVVWDTFNTARKGSQ